MKTLNHGKASTYNNHKCRCDLCREAWRKYITPRVQAHRRGERYTLRDENYIPVKDRYDEILKHQNGICAICQEPPNGKRLSLDHDHATGEIRGLLCSACNFGIGFLKDSKVNLQRAIEYLDKPPVRGTQIFL